jgi:hypothetical protein
VDTYDGGVRGCTVSRQVDANPRNLDADAHVWHDGANLLTNRAKHGRHDCEKGRLVVAAMHRPKFPL